MRDDALGQRQVRGHQKRWPIDTMEADDLFADHVHVSRPVVLVLFLLGLILSSETECSDVVAERVEPDVNDVLRIAWYGNAPLEGAAANRLIAQAALYESDDFVAACFRADKIRVPRVMLQQLVRESRELEVIVLFADSLSWPSTLRAGRSWAGSVNVKLVEDAVLAGVRSLVNEALFLQTFPQRLHATLVAWLGSAYEIVVGDAHPVKKPAEFGGDRVSELLRRLARGVGGTFDLLPMLVCTGEQKRVVAEHALTTGHGIAHQRGVRMPDVRTRVHVIDRRRNVKLQIHRA